MLGIILAGGNGTRLYPATASVSKQLMPIYDKPMIYYPLSILMEAGIKDVLIITTPRDIDSFQALFGNGNQLGINIDYLLQTNPNGIAESFMLTSEYLHGEKKLSTNVCLILGDNIFYANGLDKLLAEALNESNKATIFTYKVDNPSRYGVVEMNDDSIERIVEKPAETKSDLAITGLYVFPSSVYYKSFTLKKSERGEYEIVDLINLYLEEQKLKLKQLPETSAWLDTGTHESLLDASNFIHILQKRQGINVGCLEEIAFNKKFINKEQLNNLINKMGKSTYGEYLRKKYK